MPYITDAYTDCTPAAAAYHDRLYVAFKDHDSQHIRLASTNNPDDEASWVFSELPPGFSGAGPSQILTCTSPALSVVGDSLWLAFKGHDNSRVWLASMRDNSYQGQGYLPDAETSEGPSMAGPMVVYRGERDFRIWYSFVGTPGGEQDIPHASARTSGTPAVVNIPNGDPLIAFRHADTNEIMFSSRGHTAAHPRGEWTAPAGILDAESDDDPALAVHHGVLYMAYVNFLEHQVQIASRGHHPWTAHGTLPGVNTIRMPALVSFGGRLYVVFKGHNNDRVWYDEVPVDIYHPSVEFGFRPNPNGFAFHNFSEGAPDWGTFRDTFGEREIDGATAGALALGPAGLLFWAFYAFYQRFLNGRINTGMCTGYAASSLHRYWAAPSTQLYTQYPHVDNADALEHGIRRELTLRFGRLLSGEILTDLLRQCQDGQANVLASLRAVERDLAGGSGPRSSRIVFFVPAVREVDGRFFGAMGQTHAVVPYKIEYPMSSNGSIRMYVYDCNHPGNNPASNPDGFSYIEFTGPHSGAALDNFTFYTGSASSEADDTLSSVNGFTLATMTLEDYLYRDISLPLYLNFVIDFLDCPAELRIRNNRGQMTGCKDGRVHWEIPGSFPLYPTAAGFLLPRGGFSREIEGTGDGPYTFWSLNPDGSSVMVQGQARGGRQPSRDTVSIDRTARTVSIQSEAGAQRCTVALRAVDASGTRIVALSNLEIEEGKPLTLAYSKGLESVQGTYAGADRRIDAGAFYLAMGEKEPRKAQAQPKLEKGKTLQLRLRYGAQVSIKE
jgi:hypothetical protein